MKKIALFFLLSLMAFSSKNERRLHDTIKVWNEKTKSYLLEGYKKDYPNVDEIKKRMRNDYETFCSQYDSVDTNSLRYQFIATIQPILKNKGIDSFFVIESSTNGERILFYMYLITPDKGSYVYKYDYHNWVGNNSNIDYAYIEKMYSSSPTKYGLGDNLSSVIITFFNWNNINSKCFLPTTINKPLFGIGQ